MILFFDTSAIVKRYVSEIGSQKVDELFESASQIIISPVTRIETISTIRRLLHENLISEEDFKRLKKEIYFDFRYFTVLLFRKSIEKRAIALIEKHQLKTLDSIQLASCISQKGIIDSFVVSDSKLKKYAIREKIMVIDPTEF